MGGTYTEMGAYSGENGTCTAVTVHVHVRTCTSYRKCPAASISEFVVAPTKL